MPHPTALDLLDAGYRAPRTDGPFTVEILHGTRWATDTRTDNYPKAQAIAHALREIQKQPGGSLGGGTEVRIRTGSGRSTTLP